MQLILLWMCFTLQLLIKLAATLNVNVRHKFNPMDILTSAVNVLQSPDTIQALQQIVPGYAGSQTSPISEPLMDESETQAQMDASSPLRNLTHDSIQNMEAEAAKTSKDNANLLEGLEKLTGEVSSIERRVNSLKERGALDNTKVMKFAKFQKNISPSLLSSSLETLGLEDRANGVLEAPIVFLQPSALPLGEKLNLYRDENCEDEVIKNHELMEKLSSEYQNLNSESAINEAIDQLETEYKKVKHQRDQYLQEERDLQMFVKGDAMEQSTLNQIKQKVKKLELSMEDLNLRLRLLQEKLNSSLDASNRKTNENVDSQD